MKLGRIRVNSNLLPVLEGVLSVASTKPLTLLSQL